MGDETKRDSQPFLVMQLLDGNSTHTDFILKRQGDQYDHSARVLGRNLILALCLNFVLELSNLCASADDEVQDTFRE